MNHSGLSKSGVAVIFVLSQISINGLLLYMCMNREFRISNAILVIVLIIAFVADVAYLFYYLSFIHRLYLSEFSKEVENSCQSLYDHYLEYGKAQKEYQKETHDVINAQFTYHSLLDQGKTDEAEQFRISKINEWKTQS